MATYHARGIVFHCSASTWGDAKEITSWHLARGFATIGYHRVILNGVPKAHSRYATDVDGVVQQGRPVTRQGAHCAAGEMNEATLGICILGDPGRPGAGVELADASLVVKPYVTRRQAAMLIDETARLCIEHGWNPEGTFRHPDTGVVHPVLTQHSDHDKGKPFCANLRMDAVRKAVARRVAELRAAG